MRLKIDCHTHIVNEEIRRAYFSGTDGYALVMQFPPSIMPCPDVFETVKRDERLFLCPAVDLRQPIPPQLERIAPLLEEYRVVGLKIYLSYQKGRASDERLFPAYRFAEEHELAVTFHTGLCSLVLPSDEDIEGSDARYVAQAAERFPRVNFICAHMDDPRLTECVRLVAEHDNMFTDYSGAYEPGYAFDADRAAAAETFGAAIRSSPGAESKILYGTDFCPPIHLSELDEYEVTASRIFSGDELDGHYYKTALRAFPRLKRYIRF